MTKARRILTTLEQKDCKEALLISRRLRTVEFAQTLHDRLESMPADELDRTVQPLVEACVAWPVGMMVRFVKKGVQEAMENATSLADLLPTWAPWSDSIADGADEFDPTAPKLSAVIAHACDKWLHLDENDESDGELGPKKEKEKAAAHALCDREWQALDFMPKARIIMIDLYCCL